MKPFILWSAVLAILIGLAAVLYDHPFFQSIDETTLVSTPPATEVTEPPEPLYPVPPPKSMAEPLSEESDQQGVLPLAQEEKNGTVQESLASMVKDEKLFSLFYLNNFIQRVVVTVDSLPEKQVSQRYLPVKPPGGRFLVVGNSISPENASRYQPYLQLVELIGTERAVDLYIRFYELFQAAYRELGYPQGHFNDRLVQVIDHLLETPQVKEPLGVVKPLLVYRFADPQLEERSAGQKLLLRMGEQNRWRVLELLRDVRGHLTSLKN